MLDAILILNTKGDTLVSRYLREDQTKRLANTFRVNVVCAKSVRSPILHIGHTSYLYTKSEDIYLLITTNHNADAALIFEVLFRVVRQFGELVGKPLSAATLKTHYALVYEMIDELLDHGQPQVFFFLNNTNTNKAFFLSFVFFFLVFLTLKK